MSCLLNVIVFDQVQVPVCEAKSLGSAASGDMDVPGAWGSEMPVTSLTVQEQHTSYHINKRQNKQDVQKF